MPKQLIFRNAIDTIDQAVEALPDELVPFAVDARPERLRAMSKLLTWIADAKDEGQQVTMGGDASPKAPPEEGGTACAWR